LTKTFDAVVLSDGKQSRMKKTVFVLRAYKQYDGGRWQKIEAQQALLLSCFLRVYCFDWMCGESGDQQTKNELGTVTVS